MNGLVIDVILENESDFVDVILKSENGSCVNVILGNGSDSCVGVIFRNDLGVDVSQIDWIPLHNGPLHYHPSFLGYLGPFSSAYLLPQIPNLSLFYTTTSSLGLFA